MSRLPDAQLPPDLPVHNNLVRATYNNPEIHRGFASLSGRVHTASHLNARTRELVVLRIAAMLAAAYEWGSHVPGARAAGLSDDDIRALREGDLTSLSPPERAAVRYAEAVELRAVDPSIWSEVSEHYGPEELLDLTMLAGFYGLASRLVLALDIPLDDGVHGLDSP